MERSSSLNTVESDSVNPLYTSSVESGLNAPNLTSDVQSSLSDVPWKWIWLVSFAVWAVMALGETVADCSLLWAQGHPKPFLWFFAGRCVQFSYSAAITPGIYWLALRFPFSRGRWLKSGLVHTAAALFYSLGGMVFGLTLIPSRAISLSWSTATPKLLLGIGVYSLFNDTESAYLLIVIIAHLMLYHRRYREREVKAAQLDTQLARTQLQFLRSQLNPHFLFNTLQSISSLMEFDVKAADAMMVQLGDLLRSALDNMESQETSLQSEVDFVGKYLGIEQYRLGQRLKVCMDLAPDTLDAQIPYLTLQPLVENAVVHGISKIANGGELRIQSRRDGDTLSVDVRNDMPAVEQSMSWKSIGIGLGNTRERLKQLYGANHTAVVRKIDASRVEVCVRIPFVLHSASKDELSHHAP